MELLSQWTIYTLIVETGSAHTWLSNVKIYFLYKTLCKESLLENLLKYFYLLGVITPTRDTHSTTEQSSRTPPTLWENWDRFSWSRGPRLMASPSLFTNNGITRSKTQRLSARMKVQLTVKKTPWKSSTQPPLHIKNLGFDFMSFTRQLEALLRPYGLHVDDFNSCPFLI